MLVPQLFQLQRRARQLLDLPLLVFIVPLTQAIDNCPEILQPENVHVVLPQAPLKVGLPGDKFFQLPLLSREVLLRDHK
jgi:hypothetical protein